MLYDNIPKVPLAYVSGEREILSLHSMHVRGLGLSPSSSDGFLEVEVEDVIVLCGIPRRHAGFCDARHRRYSIYLPLKLWTVMLALRVRWFG
jgi:hypothetical protein